MKQSALIRPSVLGDKKMLSPEARASINGLAGPRPRDFLLRLAAAWAVIITAIALAVTAHNAFVSILAIVVVATRFNVLFLLIHEQAHCLGFKSRHGDYLVNFFAAYPLLLVTVEGYSQVHLAHHRFYFTEKDPDILRKSGVNWTFPMEKAKLAKLFLADLFGLNTWRLIKGKMAKSDYALFKRPSDIPPWVRPSYFLAVAAILTLTHAWGMFLLYWLLPILTVFQAIVRLGALCEHQYIFGAGVAETSPIIIPKWWENIILPNLNFNLHPYHHFFPGVACFELPRVHDIFRQEGLVDETAVFRGYSAYLKTLVF